MAASSVFDNPLALLFVIGSLLAVSTIFAKMAPALGWHPLALLQWSVLGGAIVLFVSTRLLKCPRRGKGTGAPANGQLTYYLFVTGILFIAPNMIAVIAAPKVGAGFVSLSFAFPLVLTYGFAVVLGLERFQFLMAGGVISGLAGGVMLAVSGTEISAQTGLWPIFTLFIPVFLAAGNIYRTLKWPSGAKPVDLALGMMVTGFLVLAAFNAALQIPVYPESWNRQASGLLLAQIAVFAVQYGFYFRLQKTAGPVYLSQIGSVAAVVGLGLGYLVFGEVPNTAKALAVAFVAIGITLVTVGRRQVR